MAEREPGGGQEDTLAAPSTHRGLGRVVDELRTPPPLLPADVPADVAGAAESARNHLGDYVLIEQVGAGGAGAVFRAWQKSLGRVVALKLLHHNEGIDAQRLLREARTAARLAHPHIVPIYEVGEHEGRVYLSMKLVAGRALDKVKLGARHAAEVMRDVAEAVAYAHAQGIVHRDLKPQNLMLGDDGHAWVMDFGLARDVTGGQTLTATGMVVGTPAYMPPEQATGKGCDERSDVYSMGATLYEMLAGRPAFEGPTAWEIMAKVVRDEPTSIRRLAPKVDAELEVIVRRSMEHDPRRRYAGARAFGDDLRRHLAGEPILARPVGPAVAAVKWARRNRGATAVIGVVVAALGALAMGGVFYVGNVRRARDAAESERLRADAARGQAERAHRSAALKLAESVVAQGDALVIAGRHTEAQGRYREGRDMLAGLGAPTLTAELGLMDVQRRAPAPLLSLVPTGKRITAVALTADARHALAGMNDGAVVQVDVLAGLVRARKAHRESVRFVAMAGVHHAVSADAEAMLFWDPGGGGEPRRVPTATPAWSGIFLPGLRAFVTGHGDGTLALWDFASGRQVRAVKAHAGEIRALATSHDGRRLLSASSRPPDTVKLWDLPDLRRAQALPGHRSAVWTLEFSPDDRFALVGGSARNAELWDLRTLRQVRQGPEHLNRVAKVRFLPGGRAMSVGRDGLTKTWELATGREIGATVIERSVQLEAFDLTPDVRFAASISTGERLNLWYLGGDRLAQGLGRQGSGVRGLALSPDGRLAASLGEDRALRVWDLGTGRVLLALHGHAAQPGEVAFAPDGRTIVSGDEDGWIRVWDLPRGALRTTWQGHPGAAVSSVSVSPDGRQLLSAGTAPERSVHLWDLETGRRLKSLPRDVRGVGFAGFLSGTTAITTHDSTDLMVWDLASGTGRMLVGNAHRQVIRSVLLSHGTRHIVTASSDRTAKLWDLESGRHIRTFGEHGAQVLAAGPSPDGRRLVSASEDGTVRVWDVASGRELHSFAWHRGRPTAFVFRAADGTGVSGDSDGYIETWDFNLAARVREMQARVTGALVAEGTRAHAAEELRLLGEWYALRGVWDWAVEFLERARDAGAHVPAIDLGRAYWQKGDVGSARKAFAAAREAREASDLYLDLVLGALDRDASRTTAATAAPTRPN